MSHTFYKLVFSKFEIKIVFAINTEIIKINSKASKSANKHGKRSLSSNTDNSNTKKVSRKNASIKKEDRPNDLNVADQEELDGLNQSVARIIVAVGGTLVVQNGVRIILIDNRKTNGSHTNHLEGIYSFSKKMTTRIFFFEKE